MWPGFITAYENTLADTGHGNKKIKNFWLSKKVKKL